MNLSRLFALHAIVTLVAGVVLIVAPDLIPRTVGIHVDRGAYLVCYLLAAMELGVGVLSFYARTISDARAVRAISGSFIVMHAATAVLLIYAFTQGVSAAVWANVALRVLVITLFAYYGVYKTRGSHQ